MPYWLLLLLLLLLRSPLFAVAVAELLDDIAIPVSCLALLTFGPVFPCDSSSGQRLIIGRVGMSGITFVSIFKITSSQIMS